jgi:hypothetical protein
MFCTDRFRIADGSEIELLIPLNQFFFIRDQRHHLTPCDVNIEQSLRVVSEFFHRRKL